MTKAQPGKGTIAEAMARAALAFAPDDLTPEVTAKLKTCLIDFLSCAYEAQDLPWARQAKAVTRHAAAGTAETNIIGTDLVAAPGDAAFVNATLGHGLVREDMHAASISHHGVVVWPVLLALAQRTPCAGPTFLSAAAVGYEAGARLGAALFTADLARLYRPTSTVAPVGAALAASRLLWLDEETAVNALSLAANTASGMNQWPHAGGSEMYFQPAYAARNTITAVELAEQGAYASHDILEGEGGLFAAYRRERPAGPITLFENGGFEILKVFNKPVPACNFAQTACQAAVQVAVAIGQPSRQIEAVTVRVTDAAVRYPGCDFAGPFERALQAKMSIQFGVAAALSRGVVEEGNYARLADLEIARLIAAMTLQRDDDFTAAFPAAQGAEVEVRLSDGSVVSRRLDDVVHASDAQVRARFREAAGRVIGDWRAREVEAFIDDLENAADAGRVAKLCAREGARTRAAG